MSTTNDLFLSIGDTYSKNSEPGSRFTVNRIEKNTSEDGVATILSIRLRQVDIVPLKRGESPVFVDTTVSELADLYTLETRRQTLELPDEQRAGIHAKRNLLHKIDAAIQQIRSSESKNSWRIGEELRHLDISYLSQALGRIVVFRSHRWLAKIIYLIDNFGRNYSASMSSPTFEANLGYGFVTASSRNFIKKWPMRWMCSLLEMLNSKHKFSSTPFVTHEEELIDVKSLFLKHSVFLETPSELAEVMLRAKKEFVKKLPSTDELVEQTEMMKKYENEVEENKIGTQEEEPIITPQSGE